MEASNMVWSLSGSIACKTQLRSTPHHQPECNQPHKVVQPESDRLWSRLDRSEGASKRCETLVACFQAERDGHERGNGDARLQAERDTQERFQAKRKAFIRQAVRGAPDMSILGAPFFRVDVCRPTML